MASPNRSYVSPLIAGKALQFNNRCITTSAGGKNDFARNYTDTGPSIGPGSGVRANSDILPAASGNYVINQ